MLVYLRRPPTVQKNSGRLMGGIEVQIFLVPISESYSENEVLKAGTHFTEMAFLERFIVPELYPVCLGGKHWNPTPSLPPAST